VKRIGKCDELCSANPFCVSNIQEILDIRAPRNYYAVLTYRIRRQRAVLADGLEGEKLTIDKFGAAEDFSWEALKDTGGKADHRPANLVAAPAVRIAARRSHNEEPTPARPAESDPKVAAGAPAS
jgi:hypothetical protein